MAILVVLGLVAAFAGRGHKTPRRPPVAAVTTATTTTVPAPSTTASIPATSTVSLVSSTASVASYEVDGVSTIKVVGSSGRCWVQLRQGSATGQVIFEGVLLPGQSQVLNGPAWLRIGDPPAVAVTVNGTVLSPPPAAAGQPYDFVVE